MNNTDNKRIAKNTFYLYFRMFVMILITLYSSRIILKALGVEDYGIYNLIGGVVVLLSFVNNSMTNATQRFLSYALGIGDVELQEKTFCMSMTCHILIAVILLILAETIGLWFINTQLNIPTFRTDAAFWVFQFSIAVFVLNIIRVPYNASIISHEHMSFYAYSTIVEALLKLFIAFAIIYIETDKMILYAALLVVPSLLLLLLYWRYCKISFGKVCFYRLWWDKRLFNEIMQFSGWAMVNGGANIASQQGGNFLVNIFGGVVANAAFGVSNQVSNAVNSFVSNFQTAFQPQIVKLYASDNKEALHLLIYRTSAISFFLLFAISLPLIDQVDFVLKFWLGEVPEYSAIFCQLLLLFYLVDATQAPLWMLIYGTGNVKQYTIVTGLLTFLNIPIAFILLNKGLPIHVIFIVKVVLNIIVSLYRLLYVKYYVSFPCNIYVKRVIFRILAVLILSIITLLIYHHLILSQTDKPFINMIVCVMIVVIYSWFIGLESSDRKAIEVVITEKLKK